MSGQANLGASLLCPFFIVTSSPWKPDTEVSEEESGWWLPRSENRDLSHLFKYTSPQIFTLSLSPYWHTAISDSSFLCTFVLFTKKSRSYSLLNANVGSDLGYPPTLHPTLGNPPVQSFISFLGLSAPASVLGRALMFAEDVIRKAVNKHDGRSLKKDESIRDENDSTAFCWGSPDTAMTSPTRSRGRAW